MSAAPMDDPSLPPGPGPHEPGPVARDARQPAWVAARYGDCGRSGFRKRTGRQLTRCSRRSRGPLTLSTSTSPHCVQGTETERPPTSKYTNLRTQIWPRPRDHWASPSVKGSEIDRLSRGCGVGRRRLPPRRSRSDSFKNRSRTVENPFYEYCGSGGRNEPSCHGTAGEPAPVARTLAYDSQ
jgi:hypothetical protein